MNILFCIETLGRGGAEQALLALATQMVRNHHRVYVAVMHAPFDLKPDLDKGGVKVITMPKRYKWNLLARSKDLSRLSKQYSTDVVHAHLYFPSILAAFMKVVWRNKVVTLATFHNLAYSKGVNKAGIGLWLRKALGSVFYPIGIDQCLAVSNAVAKHYQHHLALTSVDVLYNGIDLSTLPSGIPELSNKSTDLCLLVPGRLVEEKGHCYFIQALEKLVAQGLACRVIFAGGGPLQATLSAQLEQAGLTTITELTGTLTHSDMLDIIAQADVVVIPSVFEGFGIVALEAMALGKAVIASRAGGLPEIINDGVDGILVGIKNVEELVVNVDRLVTDTDLRKSLAKHARQRVNNAFSIEGAAVKLEAIYQHLLTKPS